jgi:Plasmid pRiA4b ORF-3-like protein
MVQSNASAEIYQLHILLLQINPPIWRRLHVRSDSSIATLHELLQIAFDCSDFHLHRFVIRGKEYGLSRIGGSTFRTDAKKALLSQFHFRVNERFLYEYDFGDLWQHQIRFEGIEPVREKKLYPVCVGGACASPPEDCGGPEAYMEKMDDHRWNPPMDELQLIAETVGRVLESQGHESQTAQRLDDELGEEQDMFIGGRQRDWDRLPDPAAPLIVGIDGGYVHAKDQQSRAEGWFEVIVGKSMSQDGESSKCFGFVNRYDTKPKRRLFEMLKSQGMQMNQAVTFLSDGGDTVRDLQLYLNPQAEHLLDWFHISMRLTVMSQLAKSIEADDQPNLSAEIEKDLKRLKWNLWHGNVHKALQIVEDLEYALDLEENSQEQRKLLKAVREFGTYIAANRTFIPNYGDRYRHGETISTAFVESAIKSSREQAHGEETADALDRPRCPSFTASADPRFE